MSLGSVVRVFHSFQTQTTPLTNEVEYVNSS